MIALVILFLFLAFLGIEVVSELCQLILLGVAFLWFLSLIGVV